jgi:hypothetical protein
MRRRTGRQSQQEPRREDEPSHRRQW